jgi:beta-lactamase regulating signal transducer with metallopeptidase domain
VNSDHRAFAKLLTVSAVAAIAAWIFACCLVGVIVYRTVTEGAATLWEPKTIPVLVLFVLIGVGLARAATVVRDQTRATRALAGRIRALSRELPASTLDDVRTAGLEGRVQLVESSEPFSFTYGVRPPRVVISEGLVLKLSGDELGAVLEHERYHLQNADPLKAGVALALSRMFFYLPVLHDLRGHYIVGRELVADRRAMDARGARSLAGALQKVLQGPVWFETGAAAAIGGSEALDARVAQLESGEAPPPSPRSRTAVGVTIGAGTVLAGSLVGSLVAFGPVMARLCGA